jgi:branched-chain amino acid transport system ATP-binding protein
MVEREHMLELRSVFAGYGELEILHGVSLTVSPGEIVALIGSNGAGKTTLMRAITGLLKLRRGDLLVNGQSLRGSTPERIVGHGVSLVPEGRRVFAGMTVEDNLLVGGWGLSGSAKRRRLAELIAGFPTLADRLKQDAGSLSGGQQQLMVIARALMASPSLLLLDEPSLGLSPMMVETVFEAVKVQQSLGVSVLLVEQNVAAGLRLADRGYVIESGQIVRADDADALLADPSLSNSFLGAGA